MARPKKFGDTELVGFTFKMPIELKAQLFDYAFSCGQKPCDILVEFVTELVDANKAKIDRFRRQKDSGVKATFAAPTPPKKPARPSKKNPAAQVTDSPTSEGDVTNAEN